MTYGHLQDIDLNNMNNKEDLIKEYVKNGGDLFTIGYLDTIRDGGTIDVHSLINKRICCIHKDNFTLHTDYPPKDTNLITDEPTKTYILDRLQRYQEDCEHKVIQANRIIQNINL